jgi:hypothetical protein
MTVDFDVVCWTHHERTRMGSLRDWEPMVTYFLNHKLKIPTWLPEEMQKILKELRAFQERHKGCPVSLIHDHMDLEDAFFMDVDYNKELPTPEMVKKFVHNYSIGILPLDERKLKQKPE